MIKLYELSAFAISVLAFAYGALRLLGRDTPRYFKFFVCAASCYMLEELWVIVNSLLGNGAQDGLVTVRLFGFFGCLCFMLSASANGLDGAPRKKAEPLALIAPCVLLLLYALNAFSPKNELPAATVILGLISISPALPASFFSLGHLLSAEKDLTRGIELAALVFYTANFAYPLASLSLTQAAMSVYDLCLAAMLFVIILLCGKGDARCKTPT